MKESPTQAQVPRAPLKLPTQPLTTPSSSASVSPVDSHGRRARRRRKSWESAVSVSSSRVNTSAGSDPQWETESVVESEGGELDNMAATRKSECVRQLGATMRAMHRRVHVLQMLMQQAPPEEKHALRRRARSLTSSCPAVERTRAVNALLDPGASSCASSRSEPQTSALVVTTTVSEVVSPPLPPENASRSDTADAVDVETLPSPTASSQTSEYPAEEVTELLARMEFLQSRLEEAEGENNHLREVVRELEDENARLREPSEPLSSTASTSTASDSAPCSPVSNRSQDDVSSESEAESEAESEPEESSVAMELPTTRSIFGEPSPFALVMREDLRVLRDHERCQHKLHELWASVCTLRTLVDTYDQERHALRDQRDEAVAAAERAWADNARLAGSSNPQQKIRYLQQVKEDNRALRLKVRELQTALLDQRAAFLRQRQASLDDSDAQPPQSTTETLIAAAEMEPPRDDEATSRGEILRGMWQRADVLTERLARLHRTRQELGTRQADADADADGHCGGAT